MDKVWHRPNTLAGLSGMVEELVGTGGRSIHIRCLHYEKDSLDMVERIEESFCP